MKAWAAYFLDKPLERTMTFTLYTRALMLLALVSLVGVTTAAEETANLHPCTGLPITGPPYYTDVDFTKPRAACASPTVPWVDTNAAGMIGWRYCKAPAGHYYAQWAVLPWSNLTAQPALALELMAAGLNMNDAAMDTIARKYSALIKPLAAPENAAVWCPMWPKIAANQPAKATTPSAWMVAPSGANPTRPTYPVTGGLRSRTPNGVIAVRTDCDITGAVVEPIYAGASTSFVYGSATGTLPGSVTLCVRRR